VLESLDASVSVLSVQQGELLFANRSYRLWFGADALGHSLLAGDDINAMPVSAGEDSVEDLGGLLDTGHGFQLRTGEAPESQGLSADLIGRDRLPQPRPRGRLEAQPESADRVVKGEEVMLRKFREVLRRPNGIVLVTGPTGSGKTTTLYSALSELNDVEDKLITTEDPVEYDIDGIVQVPIDAEMGNTFAAILRAIDVSFGLTPDAEIGLEANPDGFSVETACSFADAGINRLSLGVQALSQCCIASDRQIDRYCTDSRRRARVDSGHARQYRLRRAIKIQLRRLANPHLHGFGHAYRGLELKSAQVNNFNNPAVDGNPLT
jgi:energy-coupling factor transporter ATP-binding protein EcfA2